ncbi:N-acetyltransferase family protein [Tateyamaria armeniaca]|uniref:N-acetyltransferase family protein n=1 Tax=Tateyamaria armeniaca TaxID=2518930 RepID=A0ABW8UNY1_9RHOB
MTDLFIRATTADDVETWRALRLDGIMRHPEAFMMSAEAARAIPLAQDAEACAAKDRWLAFLEDTAVGFVGLHPNTLERARHRAEIGPLYVSPVTRGQGVAQALIHHAMDFGRAHGIWQFELFVNDQNVAARRLYERLGFVEAGAIPNAILGADGPERDVMMIRTETP